MFGIGSVMPGGTLAPAAILFKKPAAFRLSAGAMTAIAVPVGAALYLLSWALSVAGLRKRNEQ